jgi:hypothetical protein
MKVTYLDGKPVTDGKVELQVSRSRFYYLESKKLFQKTYSVKNGMIPVVLEDLPHDTETLNFRVSNFYLYENSCMAEVFDKLQNDTGQYNFRIYFYN